MKLKTIFIIIAAALPFVVLILYFTADRQPIGDGQLNPTVFPSTDLPERTTDDHLLTLHTATGTQISVRNFLTDPEATPDPTNPGFYHLGNRFSDDANVPPPAYVIEYIETTDYFNVGLFQEPIAESRRQAEQYLMSYLGLTAEQLCQLNYMVSVPYWVNEFHTGIDLGFSFCPGSVQFD